MFKKFAVKDETIEELQKIEKEYAINGNYEEAQYYKEVVNKLLWINKCGIKQQNNS